jgi:hypothetical protein
MQKTKHCTAANSSRKRQTIPAFSVMLLLMGVVCIVGLAHLNTPRNASLVSRNSKALVAKLGSPSQWVSSVSKKQPPSLDDSARRSEGGLSNLPLDAQGPVSAALGNHDAGYWVHRTAQGFRLENPRQGLIAEFTREGAEIRSHSLRWGLEVWAYGYGDDAHRVKSVAPQAKANRVEYRRDGMMEWYENGPLGLEQGFTLNHPPRKGNGRPLTLELALRGDLAASLEPGGTALELKGKNGTAALRYTGLGARDATGRQLQSWLEVRGERVLLRVDDEGARYPVVVDPWVQQVQLNGRTDSSFGFSVAVSGNTAVVGDPYYYLDSEKGVAFVFVRSGGTWIQQVMLTASDGEAYDYFGQSVAISGGTVVVGAPDHRVGGNVAQGAAYVFARSGTTWSQQAELTASDGAWLEWFGDPIAVSGGTVVVGASWRGLGYSPSSGAAYVFVHSGGEWSQQAKLTASGECCGDEFGESVAVSGNTVVVGAPRHPPYLPYYGTGPGAAYVFVRSGTTWNQQAELTASDGASGDFLGSSVALSGSTVVVGAPSHPASLNQPGPGAAYVFVESGGAWSQQAELTASDGEAGDCLGCSAVAVSGGLVVAGAPFHQYKGPLRLQGGGAAYVFVQNGTTWSQQGELTGSFTGRGFYGFGSSAAASGSTIMLGSDTSAYVFVPGKSALSFSPASLHVASQVINTTSALKWVTVKNSGLGTVNLRSIALNGDFAVSSTSCEAMLFVTETCRVRFTFTPTLLGPLTGTLTFSDDASGSPQTVALSGTGVLPAILNPASTDYGRQKVGTATNPRTFCLINYQTAPLTNIAISTGGDFAVSATTCGTSLAARSKCTVDVTFTPTQSGTRTGQLIVNDNASNGTQTASLSGTGD